jgi:hypothetical protein
VGESLRCFGGFRRFFAAIFARLSQQVKVALAARPHQLQRVLQISQSAKQLMGLSHGR